MPLTLVRRSVSHVRLVFRQYLSPRATDVIRQKFKVGGSVFLMDYWSGEGARSYHHTAPINSMYALHESLLLLKDEGLKKFVGAT